MMNSGWMITRSALFSLKDRKALANYSGDPTSTGCSQSEQRGMRSQSAAGSWLRSDCVWRRGSRPPGGLVSPPGNVPGSRRATPDPKKITLVMLPPDERGSTIARCERIDDMQHSDRESPRGSLGAMDAGSSFTSQVLTLRGSAGVRRCRATQRPPFRL